MTQAQFAGLQAHIPAAPPPILMDGDDATQWRYDLDHFARSPRLIVREVLPDDARTLEVSHAGR